MQIYNLNCLPVIIVSLFAFYLPINGTDDVSHDASGKYKQALKMLLKICLSIMSKCVASMKDMGKNKIKRDRETRYTSLSSVV